MSRYALRVPRYAIKDMQVSKEQFESWVKEALDCLPEEFLKKINNVAFFVEDKPSSEQYKKIGLKKDDVLFGLYEGHLQSRRLNIGPVLPDRITIFRKAILSQFHTEVEIKKKIANTLRHEIAHHFGSDEKGARKAGR